MKTKILILALVILFNISCKEKEEKECCKKGSNNEEVSSMKFFRVSPFLIWKVVGFGKTRTVCL
ncbi:MAG: hypothetical protein IPQ19_06545 [Bacteroidetes bacterium]|nr:hypothetical protein [Bacteroidota bacterium]